MLKYLFLENIKLGFEYAVYYFSKLLLEYFFSNYLKSENLFI